MESVYRDRWIECTTGELRIRGYYFPWGTKTVPYGAIRSVQRVDIGMLTGRGRVWGTANPKFWASLDPARPTKSTGLVIDVGSFVHPFITPDDPAAVERAIREHAGLPAADGPASRRGPLV